MSVRPEVAQALGLESALMLAVLEEKVNKWGEGNQPIEFLRERLLSFLNETQQQQAIDKLRKLEVLLQWQHKDQHVRFRIAAIWLSRIPKGVHKQSADLDEDWRPSVHARQLLLARGVDNDFIDAEIDKFLLYWMERKTKRQDWDSRFVNHVIGAWEYTAEQRARQPLPTDYEPSTKTKSRLKAKGVSDKFAAELIQSFCREQIGNPQTRADWDKVFEDWVQAWIGEKGLPLPQPFHPSPETLSQLADDKPSEDLSQLLSLFADEHQNSQSKDWNLRFLSWCQHRAELEKFAGASAGDSQASRESKESQQNTDRSNLSDALKQLRSTH